MEKASTSGLAPDETANTSEWLSRPAHELEDEDFGFSALLRRITPAALGEVAPALLRLLDDTTFGRRRLQGEPLRVSVIEAVLRAGYPWALRLTPADLEYRRIEQSHRSRRRAGLWFTGAALLLIVVAASGLGFRRMSSTKRDSVRAERQIAPMQQEHLLPNREVDHASEEGKVALLVSAMHRAEAENRPRETIAIALDCLASDQPEAKACLVALREFSERVLSKSSAAERELATRVDAISDDTRHLDETRAAVAALREVVDELPLQWTEDQRRSRAFAIDSAVTALASADDQRARSAAENCIGHYPDATECRRVWLAWRARWAPFSAYHTHEATLLRTELEREAIAWSLARERRQSCARDRTRPIGCL